MCVLYFPAGTGGFALGDFCGCFVGPSLTGRESSDHGEETNKREYPAMISFNLDVFNDRFVSPSPS